MYFFFNSLFSGQIISHHSIKVKHKLPTDIL